MTCSTLGLKEPGPAPPSCFMNSLVKSSALLAIPALSASSVGAQAPGAGGCWPLLLLLLLLLLWPAPAAVRRVRLAARPRGRGGPAAGAAVLVVTLVSTLGPGGAGPGGAGRGAAACPGLVEASSL